MKNKLAAGLVALALIVPMVGCGSEAAKTKCSDFVQKSDDEKKKLLKDDKDVQEQVKKLEGMGSEDEILGYMVAGFTAACQKEGNADKALADLETSDMM